MLSDNTKAHGLLTSYKSSATERLDCACCALFLSFLLISNLYCTGL